MGFFQFRQNHNLAAALMIVVSAVALGACQKSSTSLDNIDSMSTGSTTPASYQVTSGLGKAWEADPTDIGKGLAYANGLESLGQSGQQLDVIKKLYESHPDNTKLATLFGKKLAQAGHMTEARPILEKSAAAPGADWRVHSALGAVYDQLELYDLAQAEYTKALTLQPNELSVLNNKGMSHALKGDLKEAEATLRQAMQLPKAASQPRLRQNLALIVGLQGRFEESRKIASEDLPPEEVEANLAYLQKMLSQPNTWQQLSDDGGQG